MSPASTANLAATALIEPRAPSNSAVEIENCLIRAILPSTVLFRSSNDGASVLFAKAFNACSVSWADKPA